jgi:hypothetical protein
MLWTCSVLAVVGGAVGGAIAIGNTGKSLATPIDTTKRAWVYHEPQTVRLTKSDRLTLFHVSSLFIQTAVLRRHLHQAWQLLGPDMRAGQTEKSFESGFNNVVPFGAVGIASWNIDYAYRNDVALDLALIGPKTGDWAGKTFTIELKRYPSHPHAWLVASWTPRGVGGSSQIRSLAKLPPPPNPRPAISAKWLVLPLLIFGGLILSLTGWGISLKLKQRRAARRYAELLTGARSSSSQS